MIFRTAPVSLWSMYLGKLENKHILKENVKLHLQNDYTSFKENIICHQEFITQVKLCKMKTCD